MTPDDFLDAVRKAHPDVSDDDIAKLRQLTQLVCTLCDVERSMGRLEVCVEIGAKIAKVATELMSDGETERSEDFAKVGRWIGRRGLREAEEIDLRRDAAKALIKGEVS